jgi:hypothetical protein
MSNGEFLINVDGDFFLQEMAATPRGGIEVHGTRVISAALHFNFSEAERRCQQLRRRGYPYCVTTTIDGRPVTQAILRGDDAAKDDLPRSQKDLDAIPASEFKRRMKNDAPFVGRVHEIWKLKAEGQM